MKFLAIVATAAFVGQASAKPAFLALIPGSGNVKGVSAIGHANKKGGGELSAFGAAFKKAGAKWSVELCYADSDEDGQFNGAELGDPCCEWVQETNDKLVYEKASNPGDKDSTNDEKLWASVKCADGSDPVTKFKAFTSGGAAATGSAGASNVTAPTTGTTDDDAEKATSSGSSAASTPVTTAPVPAPSSASQTILAASTALVAAAAYLL
ncbi:hypothetical protein Poli38472_002888 [Pythium oligandrum]|uniref:Temptin Cys/Cys disulfide domain-containing protein n=1 Tax=Pythium oligandrum TaxID=41045 RepID=A0A8K1C625_PYTOL|nr:hypothetical protein Poli38472_002888 [Pythium oligandrum]|eukprot:TMW56963.1 hypothetical protein Poli38472_002888 [Pythium oligandrum]